MPQTRLAADAFGVVTICLVFLLVLLALLCIIYSIYFRSQIRRQGLRQLAYFNGPWIIRILLILIVIWWGLGEIIRLSLLKGGGGRVPHALSLKWQENICKFYILSNLGFAEPSLFITLVLLLRASLKRRDLGNFDQQWNRKTFGYIILCCLPVFIGQLVLLLIGPKLNNTSSHRTVVPKYFTRTSINTLHFSDDHDRVALCTYPLLSTLLNGLFSAALICYFLYLGKRMLSLVINKGLRRRVYLLIISVIGFLPFRIVFLGLSVLSQPGYLTFETLVFLAFLMLLSCGTVGICMLVYRPIADSLAVRSLRHMGAREVAFDDNDNSSLVANQSLLEAASTISVERNSDTPVKGGSISFRTMIKDDPQTEGVFEELSLFSSSTQCLSSPRCSPPLPGRPVHARVGGSKC